MQVSATLIAAQQAAREARNRLNVPQAQAPQFAAALEKTSGVSGAFAPLPLKQTAPVVQTAAPQPSQPNAASGRLGQLVNILV
ncbi:MAG: hypothetical protein JWP16_864 [Alphaproteobacteria bacterium]|jgi:hypothetical protein|nr:hypothetical protein [Alphaproteobacteria bacterium]MDB5739824.1 hypothetical protein [Alphaproteobacteria bacterium]